MADRLSKEDKITTTAAAGSSATEAGHTQVEAARASNIFVSYAHEDEMYRRQLDAHLSAFRRAGLVLIWHDRKIMPGDNLSQVIDSKIETADIVLLLISPDFIASDYCFEIEMSRALQRHKEGKARVIPIIVRPCHWKGMPFAELLVLPTDGTPVTEWPNQDKAWLSVAVGLGQALESTAPNSSELPAIAAETEAPELGSDDECLLRVSRLSQKAEKLLRERFNATGNGLGELLRSRRAEIRKSDAPLERALGKFAPLRNKILHNEDHQVDLQVVQREVEALDRCLEPYMSKRPSVTVATEPRQWFVCPNGMGDYLSISEALAVAAPSDTIFVLPGTYREEVVVEKSISLLGRPAGGGEVTIEAMDGDGVQIAASGVTLSDFVVRADTPKAFGAVAFPATEGTRLERCRVIAGGGTGVAIMRGAAAVLDNCSMEKCLIGIRTDGTVRVEQGSVAESEHGVLMRGAGSAVFEKVSIRENLVAVELHDDSRATFVDCSFEPGEFGAVATNRSVCSLQGCHFGSYGADAMIVKVGDECAVEMRGAAS